jgi:hypothetical protein
MGNAIQLRVKLATFWKRNSVTSLLTDRMNEMSDAADVGTEGDAYSESNVFCHREVQLVRSFGLLKEQS